MSRVFPGLVAVFLIGLSWTPGCGPTQDLDDRDGDGWTGVAGDCDDLDATVHPGQAEICNGRDDDCDGAIDGDAVDAVPWFTDADDDGYGAAALGAACTRPEGASSLAGDCDDSDPDIHPDATEHCDGVDEDCDGTIDEQAADAEAWHLDMDGDGWASPDRWLASCEAPEGLLDATLARDCDDHDPEVHPEAKERCNDIDNDCDGATDDGDDPVDPTTWYDDDDGDGWGDDEDTRVRCDAPPGHRDIGGDCDDRDAAVNPGATEVCNTLDDDCDGDIDEDDAPWVTWYIDADGDGRGDPATGEQRCDLPSGMVQDDTDCDDTDFDTHPGAVDLCDGVDQDCDGADDCEDCSNGIDDDGDGLVDCEDATCAEDGACIELACDDGLDGDNDGLTDCEDEDCWGPACHPAGVRSWAMRGRYVYWNAATSTHTTGLGSSCDSAWERHWQASIRASGLVGRVQVLPPGVDNWSATTARTTCIWEADAAFVSAAGWSSSTESGYARGLSSDTLIERSEAAVRDGCRLADDLWFLPQQLWLQAGQAYTVSASGGPGALWYDPSVQWRSGHHTVSTTVAGTDCGSTRSVWRQSSSMNTQLQTGDTYLALP